MVEFKTICVVLVEYDPTSQSVHRLNPMASLYFPAMHSIHMSLSSSFVYPTSQVQSVSKTLRDGDVRLGGHFEQAVALDTTALYVPEGQSLQDVDPPLVVSRMKSKEHTMLPSFISKSK